MKYLWIAAIALGVSTLAYAQAAEARPRGVAAKRPVRSAAPAPARKRPFTTSYISPRIRHDPGDNPWASPVFQQARAMR